MGKSIVADKSFDFAVKIVNIYKFLSAGKREFVISKQLLRSGTSIGANIAEALQAQSKRDYLHKMNISLKEANESLYWIRLLHATEFIDEEQKEDIFNDCTNLVKILASIVKTTKINLKDENEK